jgi:hypothetical protein
MCYSCDVACCIDKSYYYFVDKKISKEILYKIIAYFIKSCVDVDYDDKKFYKDIDSLKKFINDESSICDNIIKRGFNINYKYLFKQFEYVIEGKKLFDSLIINI